MLFVALSRSTFRHASSSTRFSTNFRAQREYANVLVSWPSPGMALITLNRPKALNAVHFQDISDAMKGADEDASVGAMILTESERAFAAGVDIKEMKDKSFVEAYTANFLANWEVIPKLKKPVIAALGGGLELALQADIPLAAPSAHLGQPEVNLGVIPGGGTQCLACLIGKLRAMELVLTRRIVRVVREGSVADEAVKVASDIASKGRIAVSAGNEAVNAAFEMSLAEGLRFEKRLFHALFGIAAFAEKRRAEWMHS
ncbi:ClpP crotonase [Suillus lakei]|nr:ClpP crotonase [Suillus lakei]